MIVLSYKIPPVSYRTFLLFDISLYTLLFFYLRRKMYRITFVKKNRIDGRPPFFLFPRISVPHAHLITTFGCTCLLYSVFGISLCVTFFGDAKPLYNRSRALMYTAIPCK